MQRLSVLMFLAMFSASSFVQVRAGMMVRWREAAGDVIASYSGSLDLTDYALLPGFFDGDLTVLRNDDDLNALWANIPDGIEVYGQDGDFFVDTGFRTGTLLGAFDPTQQVFGYLSIRSQ
ncbi:MAG: hypothetical protein AAF664_08655 [Planctomycetota bacterium]